MSEPNTQHQLKRALLAVEKMQARLEAAERVRTEPIAVIGLACRFPGAADAGKLWRLLHDGRDATGPAPAGRNPQLGRCGFLRDIENFDHDFFRITPKEAAAIDPQQRVLLEVAWESLEDACVPPTSLFDGNTGVYIGACSFDFALWRGRRAEPADTDAYFATGTALSVNAGRLSYFLGLTGPAMTIDTACSSSLVAIHQACAALRASECDLALAGGVSLLLAPEYSVNFEKAGMLAADGRCKTFDARADGFARAEGCGLVVLKKLSVALAEGDRVRAVILGSAVNQDGASGGLTVPSGPSQEAVIRKALASARCDAAAIDYLEAHGTGTSLGDPIEIHAINEVFAGRTRPLAVGSVKTNIGHCEAAAGVAGVIKTILAMEAGVLPPHLHLDRPSPHVDLARLPIEIPSAPQAWRAGQDQPRRAGISAFGFSGTNAHLILEQAPPHTQPAATTELFAISAATPPALRALAQSWAHWLDAHASVPLANVCAAALRGRSHLPHRFAVVAYDAAALAHQLREFQAARTDGPLQLLADAYIEGSDLPLSELAPAPWPRLSLPAYPFQRTRHWLEDPSPAVVKSQRAPIADRLRQSQPHERRDVLIHWLADELAEIMGVTDAAAIDPHRGFADLGLDSMMAAQLAEAVHRGLSVDVSVIAVLNYPTLSDLAAHLLPESPAARATAAPASLDEHELIAQIAARFEESHGR